MWLFNHNFRRIMSKLDYIENFIINVNKEINMLSSEMQKLTDSSDAIVVAVQNAVTAIATLEQEVADLTAQVNPEDVAQMTKLAEDLDAAKNALVAALPVTPAPEPPVEPVG